LLSNIRELMKYRELLIMFTWRDIKIKYKQSVLGLAWAVLMPSFIVLAGVLVRVGYAHVAGRPLLITDLAGVAVKSIPWAFFVSAVRFSGNSLISNTALVTKIYFPKEIFPIASIASSFFDLIIASLVLAVLLFFGKIGVSMLILWVPVLLFVLVILVAGISMYMAAASLFYRDVKYILEVLLTFGIFFTPVFFNSSMLGIYGRYLKWNPLTSVLEGLEDVIVFQKYPETSWLLYSFLIGMFLLLSGYVFFKRAEPNFAERI